MSSSPTVSEPIQKLQLLSQKLWRESHLSGFLYRFLEIGAQNFAFEYVSVFSVSSAGSAVKIDDADIDLKALTIFSSEQKEGIMLALKHVDFRHADVRDSFFQMTADQNTFSVLVMGAQSPHCYVCVWSGAQNDPVDDMLLNFLCRQVQAESLWFQRLDRTQSLIYRDDLTGLFNSRYLDVAIDAEIRRSQRFHAGFSLLFIDLDHFKEVNDQHGHLSGSMVLKQVADVLREVLREIDSIIRFGGDEFVVILLGSSSSTALLAGERIRKRVETTNFKVEDGSSAHITASIGIAAFPEHAQTREDLLRIADQNMYQGKRSGKNRVVIAGSSAFESEEVNDDFVA